MIQVRCQEPSLGDLLDLRDQALEALLQSGEITEEEATAVLQELGLTGGAEGSPEASPEEAPVEEPAPEQVPQ